MVCWYSFGGKDPEDLMLSWTQTLTTGIAESSEFRPAGFDSVSTPRYQKVLEAH